MPLVVTEGYEDSYGTIKKISLIKVGANPTKEWYAGKYIGGGNSDSGEMVFLYAAAKTRSKCTDILIQNTPVLIQQVLHHSF